MMMSLYGISINASVLSAFIPDAKNPLCFIDDKKNRFTSQDCQSHRSIFFNDPEQTIAFFLKQYAKWPEDHIKRLIGIKDLEQRYQFFVTHNQSDIHLECDKGFLLTMYPQCKQPLFGNLLFQIDYLLCPKLANKYSILSSNAWSKTLDDLFVYCAQSGQLPKQCKHAPIVLITEPHALKSQTYTLTAREVCQLNDVYHLTLKEVSRTARYHVYFLKKP